LYSAALSLSSSKVSGSLVETLASVADVAFTSNAGLRCANIFGQLSLNNIQFLRKSFQLFTAGCRLGELFLELDFRILLTSRFFLVLFQPGFKSSDLFGFDSEFAEILSVWVAGGQVSCGAEMRSLFAPEISSLTSSTLFL
jgi:hypothetical protein